MMKMLVERKLEQLIADTSEINHKDVDIWGDFREIEMIDFRLNFSFRHSLGKLSKFFIELENKKLMGTRCSVCNHVWLPPRVICPEDRTITEWLELPQHGKLEAYSKSAYTLGSDSGNQNLFLGYIRIFGASTAILQKLRNIKHEKNLSIGMPVKVVWTDSTVGHPMELFWFEPES